MANLMDYLAWRGDLSFDKAEVNEVDIVILSQLVMLDLNGCVPENGQGSLAECAHRYFRSKKQKKNLGFIYPDEINDMFMLMGSSTRFSSLQLSAYVEDIDQDSETQFSALTADALGIGTRFVIFSGTDDNIVAWKENFNLIYKTPTEAQKQSVRYLSEACRGFEGKVIVLGHSKGGHLSIYASANCCEAVRERIVAIYNLDGPGFPEDETQTRLFATVEKRVLSLLPQSSIIGRLLEHGEHYKIIHSEAKGIFQHDCFTWHVMGNRLVEQKEFTTESDGIDNGFKNIISSMSQEEREMVIEAIFDMLFDTNCVTLTQLAANSLEVVKSYLRMEGKQKSAVNRALMMLMQDKYISKCIVETSVAISKMSLSSEEVKRIRQENIERVVRGKTEKQTK